MCKLKKSILISFLAIMLIASSFLLFACGSKVESEDSLKLINDTLIEYKANTSIFKQDSVSSMDTNFCLADFNAEGYSEYVAVGLNYIEDNYTRLEELQDKDIDYDYDKLNKKIDAMNNSYDLVCDEYENYSRASQFEASEIINGYFARYKLSVKNFIGDIFVVAEELGTLFVNVDGNGIGEEELTLEAFNSYVHYHKLLVAKDYKNYFMDGCKGENFFMFTPAFASNQFRLYCGHLLSETNMTITLDEAKQLNQVLLAVNADRKNVEKSLENFSLYDFYNSYEGDINSYSKSASDVEAYYSSIEGYYTTGGTLSQLFGSLYALK